jgi:hypothetical protein
VDKDSSMEAELYNGLETSSDVIYDSPDQWLSVISHYRPTVAEVMLCQFHLC